MSRLFPAVVFLLSLIVPGSLSQVSDAQEVVVSVDSTNLRFSPSSVTIEEGDSVRFFWSGELLAHNAVAEEGIFDSGEASRNVDYSFTFETGTNGTYQYVCEPHESVGMVGTIVVEPATSPEIPQPEEGIGGDEDASGGDTWIPFFGLELIVLTLLAGLIFHLGRTQGIGDVRLSGTSKDDNDSEI